MRSTHLCIPTEPRLEDPCGSDGSCGPWTINQFHSPFLWQRWKRWKWFRLCLTSRGHAVSVFFDSDPKGRTFTFANTSGGRFPPESLSADQVWVPSAVEGRIESNTAASLAVGAQGQPGVTIRKR